VTPYGPPHIGTDEGRLSALSTALYLLFFVLIVELAAAFASNSLALFSDAFHVFTDFFAYAIAAAAVVLSQRHSSSRETFGWHRAEVVAAFVSGLILIAVVVRIYIEAWAHLMHPEPVDLTYMLTVPWLAVIANFYLARRMSGAQDINIEGARLHAVSDMLSSLGVIAAGVLIAATGNQVFDPLVSLFIGFLILGAAWRLLRQSADILLEKSPDTMDVGQVVDQLKAVEGVADVHQVHVWSLCSTVHAMSAHVVAEKARDTQKVLEAARKALETRFAVAYTTLQVEVDDCGADRHPTAVHTGSEHTHSHA
jgi:cobalt-zinc-cadmium efflux system protein